METTVPIASPGRITIIIIMDDSPWLSGAAERLVLHHHRESR
jgi:hypothetical protein